MLSGTGLHSKQCQSSGYHTWKYTVPRRLENSCKPGSYQKCAASNFFLISTSLIFLFLFLPRYFPFICLTSLQFSSLSSSQSRYYTKEAEYSSFGISAVAHSNYHLKENLIFLWELKIGLRGQPQGNCVRQVLNWKIAQCKTSFYLDRSSDTGCFVRKYFINHRVYKLVSK